MQTALQKAAMTVPSTNCHKPIILTKRIGSTTFIVNVAAKQSATETLRDKLLRLIERETERESYLKFLLTNSESRGNIDLLRTVRLPGGSL